MRKILYISTILFCQLGCIKSNDNIPKEYRNQINMYEKEQILVFQSKTDLDTIRIAKIDSTSSSQGPSNLPFKNLYVEIEHLPNNHWNEGIVLRKTTNKYDSISDQKLLVVSKTQVNNEKADDKYLFPVQYRDFIGSLDFQKLRLFGVDTLESIDKNFKKQQNDSSVVKIYWDYKNGIIGYEKKNGLKYKLVNN